MAGCAGLSEADLVAFGAAPADATLILSLHHTYFGATRSTRKQRTAADAARRRGHSLVTLQLIESFVAKVRDHNKVWDLRVELCQTSAEVLENVARKRLREMRKPRTYAERAKITQHDNGLATLTVTADSRELTDVFKGIDQERPGASCLENIEGGVKTEVTAMAVMQIDDYAELLKGNTEKDGEEFIVRTTDGATMTGSQLVERAMLDKGIIVAVSREHGPLDVFRDQRFATGKQRQALAAENPCCAWKGCKVPFEKCQIHHIVAWARGGPTNILNLVPLCPYHNGVNDDDPDAPPKRGRMDRIGGRPAWLPPYDASPVFTSPFN